VGFFFLLLLIWFWVPTSTLVWLAFIPSIVYSIYSKKLALSIIAFTAFAIVLILYILGCFFPAQVAYFLQSVAILLFLYTKIFPYTIQVNLLNILDVATIIWFLLFILAVVIGSVIARYNELHVMLSFSSFTLFFSIFYLLMNICMFFSPPLQLILETTIFTRWIIIVFYVLFPLTTLIFTLLFICSYAGSLVMRSRYKASHAKIQRHLKARWVGVLTKYLAIFVVILMLAIFVLGVIFS